MADYQLIPSKTALINVDMQNAFVEGTPLSAPGGVALLEPVNRLAAACREAGMMVIHTLHVVRADGSNHGTMGELIEPVRAGYINEGTETAKLHPGVDVGPKDIMLYKPRYGSFSGTDLDMLLRGNGIDSIIVTGICTNICCETTAREAGMRDYHVFFTSDGTETFPAGELSVADIKKATLTTLGLAFAKIVSVDETIDLIRRASNAVPAAAE
ncbi:cysteine hydrolase family protein [Marinibaculum pumilum]|uniref:Cysteine hydrolase family protein n=1 Tax=Marinibaculum pumilum TaxID=1766165 RepID=A0ABV7L829_9PROT